MTPSEQTPPGVPRNVPEGQVPLLTFEGTARECGRCYVEAVREQYPGYRAHLDRLGNWVRLTAPVKRLFEQRAPYVLEILHGMIDADKANPTIASAPPADEGNCTSFGIAGDWTLDGNPISGQNKDAEHRAKDFIVLRMRIVDGPTILVVAYPGELLGFGMWSTGMTLFRNSLFSKGPGTSGLTLEQFGLLALACLSSEEAAELAAKHGVAAEGNFLISDKQGVSLNVEFNVGGVSVLPARNGIATHANHPEADKTAPFEAYPDSAELKLSRHRMHHLWSLLDAERGRLTAQKTLMALADHACYPGGICRHIDCPDANRYTTAAAVAEPAKGMLHVVRGTPCANWPVTYSL